MTLNRTYVVKSMLTPHSHACVIHTHMHVWKNNNNVNISQSVLIIFTNFESSINSKIIDQVLVSFERERPLWEGPIICIQ